MPKPRSQSPTNEHFSTLHICLSVFSAWFRGLPHPAELMMTRLHPWLLWRKSREGPNSRERDRAQTEKGGNRVLWAMLKVSTGRWRGWGLSFGAWVPEVHLLPVVSIELAGQGQLPPSHFRLLLLIWASCPGACLLFHFGWSLAPAATLSTAPPRRVPSLLAPYRLSTCLSAWEPASTPGASLTGSCAAALSHIGFL